MMRTIIYKEALKKLIDRLKFLNELIGTSYNDTKAKWCEYTEFGLDPVNCEDCVFHTINAHCGLDNNLIKVIR